MHEARSRSKIHVGHSVCSHSSPISDARLYNALPVEANKSEEFYKLLEFLYFKIDFYSLDEFLNSRLAAKPGVLYFQFTFERRNKVKKPIQKINQ